MPDHKRPQNQGGGNQHKNQPPAGISQADAQALRSRVDKVEKQVQEYLAEKNQWNSLVRGWVGQQVAISTVTGEKVTGELLWVDRYTMCLKEASGEPAIVHKGAIAVVRRGGPPASE